MKTNGAMMLMISCVVVLVFVFAAQSFSFGDSRILAAPSQSLPTPIPYSTDDGATFPIGNLAMVTLGPSELLRVTAVNQSRHPARIRMVKTEYVQTACNGSACRYEVSGQTVTGPNILGPGEAASFDVPNNGHGVRAFVLSNSREVLVNTLGVDAATGQIRWTAPATDIGTVR